MLVVCCCGCKHPGHLVLLLAIVNGGYWRITLPLVLRSMRFDDGVMDTKWHFKEGELGCSVFTSNIFIFMETNSLPSKMLWEWVLLQLTWLSRQPYATRLNAVAWVQVQVGPFAANLPPHAFSSKCPFFTALLKKGKMPKNIMGK